MKNFFSNCATVTAAFAVFWLVAVSVFLYVTLKSVIVAALTALIAGFVIFVQVAGVVVLAGAVALLVVRVWEKRSKRLNDNRRQVDGAYAKEIFEMADGTQIHVSPSDVPGGVLAFHPRRGLETALTHMDAAGIIAVHQANAIVHHAQATYAGDGVLGEIGEQVIEPKVAAPRALKQPKITAVEPEQIEVGPVALLPDAQAGMQHSESQAWIVGQADDGEIISFNPELHAHAGVIGSTGSGKTKSVGFMLAAQAIKHGYHTVILDPDGGEDWDPFAGHAEHHETDREMFPQQIDAIHNEYSQRADRERRNPLFVVIEEYGDMIAQVRRVDKSGADNVDGKLDEILRRGRKRRVHLCFVDQYPEKWSQQVIGGTRFQAVFKLGPNQGNKVQQYDAAKLDDVGEFLVNGKRYHSFDASTSVPALLAGAPRLNGYRVVRSPNTTEHAPNGDRTQDRTSSPERTNGSNGSNPTEHGADNGPKPPPLRPTVRCSVGRQAGRHPVVHRQRGRQPGRLSPLLRGARVDAICWLHVRYL